MKNNELVNALSKLPERKQIYVKYRFNLWFDRNKVMDEATFLKRVGLKTMDSFLRWEKSEEFLHITTLVLQSRQSNDLLEMYEKVKKNIEGENPDKKDLEFMMKLMDKINQNAKSASEYFNASHDKGEYDELEL